jgi:hypothetical protein
MSTLDTSMFIYHAILMINKVHIGLFIDKEFNHFQLAHS